MTRKALLIGHGSFVIRDPFCLQIIEGKINPNFKTSFRCPRCQGTRQVIKPSIMESPACTGKGYLMPIPDEIRNHLRKAGIARMSANLFERELQPFFEKCWQWLYLEQQEAVNMALEKEKAVS